MKDFQTNLSISDYNFPFQDNLNSDKQLPFVDFLIPENSS